MREFSVFGWTNSPALWFCPKQSIGCGRFIRFCLLTTWFPFEIKMIDIFLSDRITHTYNNLTRCIILIFDSANKYGQSIYSTWRLFHISKYLLECEFSWLFKQDQKGKRGCTKVKLIIKHIQEIGSHWKRETANNTNSKLTNNSNPPNKGETWQWKNWDERFLPPAFCPPE